VSEPSDQIKRLGALLERIDRADPRNVVAPAQTLDGADALVHEVVFSMLAWEATRAKAISALKHLSSALVDYNELRVCLPDEVASALGPRYPLVEERSERILAVLGDIYRHQHAMSLAHLQTINKREARVYLDSLDGITPYVANRVALLALGAHAMPVDGRIRGVLIRERVVDESLGVEAVCGWIERQFRAGEILGVYLALEAAAHSPHTRHEADEAGDSRAEPQSPTDGEDSGVDDPDSAGSAPRPEHETTTGT